MSWVKILIMLLFLNACSHTKPKVSYSNEAQVMNSLEGDTEQERPYSLNPYEMNAANNPLPSATGSGAALGLLILGTATGIAQIIDNQNPKQRTDLRGSCFYGDIERAAVAVPCIRVKVSLLNYENKVIVESETDEKGAFRFYIPENKSYTVQILDRKGRTALLPKRVGRADIVSIYLKP